MPLLWEELKEDLSILSTLKQNIKSDNNQKRQNVDNSQELIMHSKCTTYINVQEKYKFSDIVHSSCAILGLNNKSSYFKHFNFGSLICQQRLCCQLFGLVNCIKCLTISQLTCFGK